MSITWTLTGRGWAACLVRDDHTEAEVTASYITQAPDDLLEAVTSVVLRYGETRVQFEAEPTVFRWIFHRDGRDVWVRLLELPVTEIWSSRQTVDTVARAFLRAFDDVAREYGHSRDRDKWGQPFPSTALERLRTTWRQYKAAEDR
jgi:hypothetical protein